MSTKQFNVIGKPLRKVDAASKCIGQTIFADDIFLPQMLYAKILRSTRPYARIRNIDTSSAETLDGVKSVLLGRELPITFGILPVSQDEHTLAIDVVRYVGEPVAAIASIVWLLRPFPRRLPEYPDSGVRRAGKHPQERFI
jgi:4-hydroxybenzoyl-CoA reductase subunit alpha